MDRSVIIYLVAVSYTANEYGVEERATTSREVFAQVKSVSRSEFFEGGRNGLNPELVFSVFAEDYEDEPVVIYDERPYSIYRTYRRRDDFIELYCERRGGTNGITQN